MLGIPVPPTARQDQRAECASAEVFYEHYSHFPTCTSIYILERDASVVPATFTAQQQRQKEQQHNNNNNNIAKVASH